MTLPMKRVTFRNGLNMEILTPGEDENFETRWQGRTKAMVNGNVVMVPVIGLEHLKQMKERAAKESPKPEKHQVDLEMLAKV